MNLDVASPTYFDSFLSFKPVAGSFYYSLIIPLVCTMFLARYLFFSFIINIGPRKFFKCLPAEKETQFASSLFYALCLICSTSLGEYATGHEEWRSNFDLTLIGWPESQNHSSSLIFYFTFCFSFYVYSLALLFLEERKRDFKAMALHHIVTMVTLFLSAYIEHPRMATCIMLLFEFAKIFTFAKEDSAAAFSFFCFVAIWIRNRLYIYPYFLVPTVYRAELINGREIPYHPLHCTIVTVIFFLNLYWTLFIIKKIRGIVKNGLKDMKKGDIRDLTKTQKTQ